MRDIGRTCGVAALLVMAAALAGCRTTDQGFLVFDCFEPQRPARVYHSRPRRLAHLAKPVPQVAPGQSLKDFCGRRHVQFQAHTLDETPDEMAHNNELCKQLYEPATPG